MSFLIRPVRILPNYVYKWLPFWCFVWASVVWVIPIHWYALLCSIVLYTYAGWLVYKRYIE